MVSTFFQLGFHHLTEAGAWDHQLFLATLALAYQPVLWRRWVLLATVFAIGHTLALVGATVGVLPVGMTGVEPGIALSIVALALVDLLRSWRDPFQLDKRWSLALVPLVLVFGLIHGMGFSGAFVPIASAGLDAGGLTLALLSFTLGVEAGQLLILAGMWVVSYLVFDLWQWRPVLLRRLLLVAVALTGLAQFISLVSS